MKESHTHKKLSITESVDVIAGNDDLLSEILLRLPARSLIRFILVCRHWCSLIKSKQFRLSHSQTLASSSSLSPSGIYFYNRLTNPRKIESLLLSDNVTSLPSLSLDQIASEKVGAVMVTQSCIGLLMCVFYCKTRTGDMKRGIVYNPAKKEHRLLPIPNNRCYRNANYYMISYPSEPPYYKAFCITSTVIPLEVDVSVYVPESESWRSCCRFSSCDYFDRGVVWNGGIYWVADYFSNYFDANSEQVVMKKSPPCLQRRFSIANIRYFGECGGYLHLIHVQSPYAKKFNVLELDKDTWKWSVKYRVHVPRLSSAFPEIKINQQGLYAFSILSVIPGENEEDPVLLLTIPGKVVAYNLVRKTSKAVCELPGEIVNIDVASRYNYGNAYQYTESLAPV